jgi:hypothetical protein
VSARQIVEHDCVEPSPGQRPNYVRANVPCPACN